MNYSTAVMLINPAIRAVKTLYEPDVPGRAPQAGYTFKTLDQTIKVGDLVIVPTDTRFNFTVNKVIDVDVEVDFDAPFAFKWIVAKFDIENYENILSMEAAAIDVIKKGELRKRREDIKKNSLDAAVAGEIDTLAIARLGAPAVETVE